MNSKTIKSYSRQGIEAMAIELGYEKQEVSFFGRSPQGYWLDVALDNKEKARRGGYYLALPIMTQLPEFDSDLNLIFQRVSEFYEIKLENEKWSLKCKETESVFTLPDDLVILKIPAMKLCYTFLFARGWKILNN